MGRTELADVVLGRIAQVLGVSVDEIGEDTDLRDDYQVDSLELMEIGTRLETALGVRIKVDDLVGMDNIGHAVDLLHQRLRERT